MGLDYSAREVADLLGVPIAEVRQWARAGILSAQPCEDGSARFSFQDLVLLKRAAALGEKLRAGFARALEGQVGVVSIRGDGLMIGIELDRPCGELVTRALERGLLINVTAEKVVRLLPALVFTDKDAQELVSILSALIREFLA